MEEMKKDRTGSEMTWEGRRRDWRKYKSLILHEMEETKSDENEKLISRSKEMNEKEPQIKFIQYFELTSINRTRTCSGMSMTVRNDPSSARLRRCLNLTDCTTRPNGGMLKQDQFRILSSRKKLMTRFEFTDTSNINGGLTKELSLEARPHLFLNVHPSL